MRPTFVNRTKMIASLLASVIFVSTCLAQQPQPGGALQDPPWLKEFAHKRIVYSVPGMTRVKAIRNQVYKRVQGEELKMDVYLPRASSRRDLRPAVIFIHDGRIPPNLLTTRPQTMNGWGEADPLWKVFGGMEGNRLAIPLYVIVDSEGRLRYAANGGEDLSELRTAIKSLLK